MVHCNRQTERSISMQRRYGELTMSILAERLHAWQDREGRDNSSRPLQSRDANQKKFASRTIATHMEEGAWASICRQMKCAPSDIYQCLLRMIDTVT